MGVRDQFERVAAWFGFGVDEDDYYDEDEERRASYGKDHRRQASDRYADDRYAGGSTDDEPGPSVRRLGNRPERSSAFGTSLGSLFGNEGSSGDRERGGTGPGSAHLRAVPDQQRVAPSTKLSVVEPSSFNDAQDVADRFKRQQPVILNLQSVDGELSRRLVDFCSGLAYALDGNIQSVANRVFLLTPRNVEVSAEERKRIAERAFFNQL